MNAGIDRPQGRMIFGEDPRDRISADVGARPKVREDVIQ
jgi:hypothetical protein